MTTPKRCLKCAFRRVVRLVGREVWMADFCGYRPGTMPRCESGMKCTKTNRTIK